MSAVAEIRPSSPVTTRVRCSTLGPALEALRMRTPPKLEGIWEREVVLAESAGSADYLAAARLRSLEGLARSALEGAELGCRDALRITPARAAYALGKLGGDRAARYFGETIGLALEVIADGDESALAQQWRTLARERFANVREAR